jgi:hypothetical protein
LAAKPFISPNIVILFFFGVLATVYFYNQALFKGYEINDVIADGLLSPEFYTLYVLTFQMKPQAIFSIGRLFSQDA